MIQEKTCPIQGKDKEATGKKIKGVVVVVRSMKCFEK
jgi:hypothetical protein